LLIKSFEPAVSSPMHARRLWREAIVKTKRPILATPLHKQPADPPSTTADAISVGFILALVMKSVAQAAPKTQSTMNDPAASRARRAGEPVTAPAKLCRRRHARDDLVEFQRSPTVAVGVRVHQTQPGLPERIVD